MIRFYQITFCLSILLCAIAGLKAQELDEPENIPQRRPPVVAPAAAAAAAADDLPVAKRDPPAPNHPPAVVATFLPPLDRRPIHSIREFIGRSSRNGPLLYRLPACRDSVRTHCHRAVRGNNFAVLDCLQRTDAIAQSLPSACQAAVWQLKYNLTHSVNFERVASGACKNDLRRLTSCSRETPGKGLRLTCLIEHRANISDPACRSYLRRLEPLVFADYRLVERFISSCKSDVADTKCGRLEPATAGVTASMPHSQGRTVACLSAKVAVVSQPCRLQLLRLGELQTSDYHNDRPLYYACRDDREKLCAAVSSGAGRVLACLNRQRAGASSACQAQLARVRQIAAYDYAIYRRFADACTADLRRLGCLKPRSEPSGSAAALLCLENGLISKGTTAVSGDCQASMVEVRSDFLSDPSLLPELSTGCSAQLQSCRSDHTAEQGLLHCIMRRLREARAGDAAVQRNRTRDCELAVDRVLRVAMPTRDIRADAIVMSGCAGDIKTHCSAPGLGNVYACLKSMLSLRRDSISADCADRVAELVYFENRNFRLNVRLFKACRKAASESCGAVADSWWSGGADGAVARGSGGHQPRAVVLNCLVGLMMRGSLDRNCDAQLTQSLRERSTQARLDARIFAPCLRDLSRHCLQSRGPGQEFSCLQDHTDVLEKRCRVTVQKVSAQVDVNIDVSPDLLFVQSCQAFVRQFCNRAEGQIGLDKTVMSCLISRKNHPQMDSRCRAGVEHHQLVSLKDYRISRSFTLACEADILRLCNAKGAAVVSQAAAVRCLATQARNDVLKQSPQHVSQSCLRQLSLELLQSRRVAGLDPEVARNCQAELSSLCPPGVAEERVACLRAAASVDSNGGRVGSSCRAALFKQDEVLLNVPVLDATLMHACRRMISRHCSDRVSRPVQLYTCLRARMHHADFDASCFSVVSKRMRMQQADYRLNPELQRFCGQDIDRFCAKQKDEADRRDAAAPDPSNQGAVTRCLRAHIIAEDFGPASKGESPTQMVRGQCRSYMRSLALEFNLNYRLNPRLAAACRQVAESYCHVELEDVSDSGASVFRVTECLKRLLTQGRIRSQECGSEVRQLLQESEADIHVDPVLYKACSSELAQLCSGVPLGAGRQMRCTLAAFRDLKTRPLISSECSLALDQRLQLMEAFRPQSLGELAVHVNESPARAYAIGLGLSLLLLAVLLGFCSGRATRRGLRRLLTAAKT